MRKKIQILFFTLSPLVIYAQDSLCPPRKIGAGIVFKLGNNFSIINKELDIPGGSSVIQYGCPHLQFTMATPKLYFHNIGFGFGKIVQRYFNESGYDGYKKPTKFYEIYYQYDFPLLKTRSLSNILYTGLNCSASRQVSELTYILGHGISPDESYGSVNSIEQIASLNLPLGHKKHFGSSWLWLDYGINLNLISYRNLKYNYQREDRDYAEGDIGHIYPPIITNTYGEGKKNKFYPIPFSPYIVNSVYCKLTFIPKLKKSAANKTYISPDSLSAYTQADSFSSTDSNKVELKRNTLFFELGGIALLYSLRYDHILKQWNKFSISSGIGLSILPAVNISILLENYQKINSYRQFTFPIHLSGLYGKNKSKLEFGVFIMPFASLPSKNEKLYDNAKTAYGSHKGINIGYRYQKKQGGLFFKTYFLAIYYGPGYFRGNSFISDFIPWIGVGAGYTFK